MNPHQTDFLFPQASLWTGVGSVLNISGYYFHYNVSPTPAAADRAALLADWNVVGDDLRGAVNRLERELSLKK